ncbi:MAG: hypothetical protein H7A25_02820 [Leptospiraceae bacterium]|nr:hypothetical protein [Leptospiraceae bacterium]MCP5498811.1 hypothetical protein [Leptospiraceae bacterium]
MKYLLFTLPLIFLISCDAVNKQIKENPELKKRAMEMYESKKGEYEGKKGEFESKKAMIQKNKRSLINVKPELIKQGLVSSLFQLKTTTPDLETVKQYIFKTDPLQDTRTRIIYMDKENAVVAGINLATGETIYFVILKELEREAKKEYKDNGPIVPGSYEIYDKKTFPKPQVEVFTKGEELYYLRLVYL